MDERKEMDLARILEEVPHLLDACVCDETASLRRLRLVNKEASRVALLGLKSYTLKLKGVCTDTNVDGASLLRQTKLQSLNFHLLLTGYYSPAVLLRAFVQEAGTALSTVNHLKFWRKNAGTSSATAASLSEAILAVVRACPALTALHLPENTSLEFLRHAGEACPLLPTLELRAQAHCPDIEDFLRAKPSPFLHLHTLIIRRTDASLPDMSQLRGLHTLNLSTTSFTSEAQWLCLPPGLQSLFCLSLEVGPPADTTCSLSSLFALHVEVPMHTPLYTIAQLLRAAPSLQAFTYDLKEVEQLVVLCPLGPETAADLASLHTRSDIPCLARATYLFDVSEAVVGGPYLPLIATLPRMTGFTACQLESCTQEEMVGLLGVFPNMERLTLSFLHTMDDLGLRAVTSYGSLTQLKLDYCSSVTPMGLLALCLRLPSLTCVEYENCERLQQPELDKCVELLRGYGVHVEFTDTSK